MDKTQQEIYDNLLLSVVFNLKDFPKKSGQEGTAYFIDENFVVKEIMGSQEGFFKYENFVSYCEEINGFREQGYPVPKIYSWTMLPASMFKKIGNFSFDRYYILEERVKGKELFSHRISESFEDCKDFCSEKEFSDAILSHEGELYKKIVETYLQYFIDTNEQLEALPESVIEQLVLGDYHMMKNQKFGVVDMHNANIMFDGKKILMIDHSFTENFFANFPDEKIRAIVMKDMLRIISGNERGLFCGAMNKRKWKDLEVLFSKHKQTASSVMKRFINVTNRVLKPVFKDDMDYANSRDFIKMVSSDEAEEKEMLDMLQKSF